MAERPGEIGAAIDLLALAGIGLKRLPAGEKQIQPAMAMRMLKGKASCVTAAGGSSAGVTPCMK